MQERQLVGMLTRINVESVDQIIPGVRHYFVYVNLFYYSLTVSHNIHLQN